MIDLFDLYNRFNSDVNTFQGGSIRPERDFEKIVNSISQDIWNDWTAQAEKTQEINDGLNPFLKSVNIIVSPASGNYGIATFPKDYGRYSVARVLLHKETGEKELSCVCDTSKDQFEDGECTGHGDKETPEQKQARIEKYKDGIIEGLCTKVESSKWASMLDHKSKCPTFEEPGVTQFDKGLKVAPRKVSVIVLDYYIKPAYAKFIFTIATGNPQTGAGDYMIYDKVASTQLEWPETMIPYFLERLSTWYSKYTRDAQLFQMSKQP